MSTKLITAKQITMWNEIVPPVTKALGASLLASEYANKKNEVIGQGLRLIPVTAGKNEDGTDKDSLTVRFPGLTKDQLVAKQNATSLDLKRWLIQQIGSAILNDETIGGMGMRVSKNKRLSMTFKTLVPQVALKTDEEYAAELGCTVEQVQAIRREARPIVEVEEVKELKPAKGNGHPELVPVIKPKKGAKAPVANPPTE